jgi:hypothetical protein
MVKRRTAAEQERIKAEVRNSMQNPPAAPELVIQRLSCAIMKLSRLAWMQIMPSVPDAGWRN